VVEVKAGPQNRSGKKRPKAATDLPQYAAFGHWQLPPFAAICAPGSTPLNAFQRPSTFSRQRPSTLATRRCHKRLIFRLIPLLSGNLRPGPCPRTGKNGRRKWLIFGLVQPISGIFSHDTYPA
jgi:hypothetical protein